ncbi:MAG TPA: hypothetical protein GX702_08720 [Chloroflexi bacterium]|nr:hypothetical protein [Chloroflexota bacterium]
MLNIIVFILDIVEQYTIWLYAALFLIILLNLRSYISAQRDRSNTIFTVEREVAAHREGRAMSNIGMMLGLMVVVTGLKFYVMPSLDVADLIEPTPTLTLAIPTRIPTIGPTPTRVDMVTPTPDEEAAEESPSVIQGPPTTEPEPEPTEPPPPPASCPYPGGVITSPGQGATVSGRIAIIGTAVHESFQFYKVEFGFGENPGEWHVIHDVYHNPVQNGVLTEFDTHSIPNGVYTLQLVVVDATSNFPPPCRVRINVQN